MASRLARCDELSPPYGLTGFPAARAVPGASSATTTTSTTAHQYLRALRICCLLVSPPGVPTRAVYGAQPQLPLSSSRTGSSTVRRGSVCGGGAAPPMRSVSIATAVSPSAAIGCTTVVRLGRR